MCKCNNKLRPCRFKEWDDNEREIKDGEGLFHQWGIDMIELSDGVENFSVGIIEKADGTVVMIPADRIQFADRGER